MVTAGDGDGWVILADGSRRWGLYGASGLLLYSVDESGTGHVLLQHRAPWTHQGGTWGLPGGARNSGESSVSAAIREFVEEVDGDLGTLSLLGIHRQDHQVWVFDTVLASVPERRPFTPGNPESESIRWIPVPDVPSMPLLPAFGKVWPEVAAALSEQLLLIVDTTVVPQSITPGALCHRLTELAQVGVTDDMLPRCAPHPAAPAFSQRAAPRGRPQPSRPACPRPRGRRSPGVGRQCRRNSAARLRAPAADPHRRRHRPSGHAGTGRGPRRPHGPRVVGVRACPAGRVQPGRTRLLSNVESLR